VLVGVDEGVLVAVLVGVLLGVEVAVSVGVSVGTTVLVGRVEHLPTDFKVTEERNSVL
jgi:hypothetical protein